LKSCVEEIAMLAPESRAPKSDETTVVDEAIISRRSVRAFLPDLVDDATIRDILTVASRAPSGTNMQPWKVYVVKGEVKQTLSDAILNSGIRAEKAEWDEYRYYPDQFFEPYLTRRRANGFGLYGALGIGRREVDKMRAQHDRNFIFFDAPIGMIFTIDRRLNQGSWIDYGMFLENIMIAARARGLHTCPQAAFAPYHRQIRPVLGISEEEIVVCGMALGHEDTSKPESTFRTDRAPLEEWVRFVE
jgi:nitroreductase